MTETPPKLAAATAAKYSKPRLFEGVLAKFPRALNEIARVSAFGAQKHEKDISDNSFLDVPNAENVYRNSESRHLTAEPIEGSINFEDGQMYHKAQKAWNALADLEVFLRGIERLEPPKPSPDSKSFDVVAEHDMRDIHGG